MARKDPARWLWLTWLKLFCVFTLFKRQFQYMNIKFEFELSINSKSGIEFTPCLVAHVARLSTLVIDRNRSMTSILLILICVCLTPHYLLLLYFSISSDGKRLKPWLKAINRFGLTIRNPGLIIHLLYTSASTDEIKPMPAFETALCDHAYSCTNIGISHFVENIVEIKWPKQTCTC